MIFPLDIEEKRFLDVLRTKAEQSHNDYLTVLDVGAANCGYSNWILNFFWKSQMRFHLFEPSPSGYAEIEKQFGNHGWFTCNNLAVTETNGKIKLSDTPIAEHSHVFNPVKGERLISVESTTLYSYINRECIREIFLLKIDTEGAEFKVIDSLRDRINIVQNIQLEYGGGWEREDRSIKECIIFLENNGFYGYEYDEKEDKLTRIHAGEFADDFYMRNLLFTRSQNGVV